MGTFKPIYLSEEDIEEISTFLNLDFEYCKSRILDYDLKEIREAWEKANPQTYKNIRRFYRDTDLYIWELTQWHNSTNYIRYKNITQYLLKRYPPCNYPYVLNYGGGIGTHTIFFAKHGYKVVSTDIHGKTFEFAKYRLQRRKLKGTFIPIPVTCELPEINERFDIILCFDVLEHLPDPVRVLSFFKKHLSSKGIIAITGPPGIDYKERPYHLPSNYFILSGKYWMLTLNNVGIKQIETNIYQRRRGIEKMLRKIRYLLWKTTNICISYLPQGRKLKDV